MNALVEVPFVVGTQLVGAMLIWSGAMKVRDMRAARIAVLDYEILPDAFVAPAAVGLAIGELACGTALVLGVMLAVAPAILLISLFTIAAASALIRGKRIDCHCGGDAERLSAATLRRNAVLLGVLVVAALIIPVRDPAVPTFVLQSSAAVASLAALLLVTFSNSFTAVVALQRAARLPRVRCGGAHGRA